MRRLNRITLAIACCALLAASAHASDEAEGEASSDPAACVKVCEEALGACTQSCDLDNTMCSRECMEKMESCKKKCG